MRKYVIFGALVVSMAFSTSSQAGCTSGALSCQQGISMICCLLPNGRDYGWCMTGATCYRDDIERGETARNAQLPAGLWFMHTGRADTQNRARNVSLVK